MKLTTVILLIALATVCASALFGEGFTGPTQSSPGSSGSGGSVTNAAFATNALYAVTATNVAGGSVLFFDP